MQVEQMNSPGFIDRLDRLSYRYQRFIHQPEISKWIAQGGEVDIATENRPASYIERLYNLGHRRFSEKFLQEIQSKYQFSKYNDLSIQFFGRLQSNKIKGILSSCDTIESISDVKQAEAIMELLVSKKSIHRFYIQLNIGKEPQKNGVLPDAAPALIEYCLQTGLPVCGLMCIPPRAANPTPYFRRLRKLADYYGLPECQMGFSADYRIAIDEGATSIRIASILFDEDN